MQLLGDTTEAKVFALMYGGSGTGKTHLCGTLGELGRVLIVDIDKGYKTLVYAKDLKEAWKKNITVCSFDAFKDLDTLAKLTLANDPKRWAAALNDPAITEPFDWIVPDTWSEIQWSMMEELRGKDAAMKGDGLKFREPIQIKHWGQMTDLNKLAIETFRGAVEKGSCNMMFTMQETMTKDELTGKIIGGPAIHGKMVQEVPAYFDVVIRTETDMQGAFVASTVRKGSYPAKTRLGAGMTLKNPTIKQLLEL